MKKWNQIPIFHTKKWLAFQFIVQEIGEMPYAESMRRTFLEKLCSWKAKRGRKPLIVKGARQVGKTYILQQFGREQFPAFHYFNFEKEGEPLARIYAYNLDPKRIVDELSLYASRKINIHTDLVIFDEIQACPQALTSLKYFQEEMSELALISAGSLLGIHLGSTSFPVGKVTILMLYPMSFDEFLMAVEDEKAVEFLNHLTLESRIPEFMHDHLWRQLKHYFIVGGLPEVVAVFCQYRESLFEAFQEVRNKQEELLTTYYGDIAKHSGKENAMHIERVFSSIPPQLAKSQDGSAKKYSFKGVLPGESRYSRLAGPIDWLKACSLIVKVPIVHSAQLPLMAFTQENIFKLYTFDVGILGQMSGLEPKVILDYDYGTFKGFFAENFIAQEFLAAGETHLYSWEEKTAELEFLRVLEGTIIPIEVKSGWVTKSKSLKVFAERYSPPYRCIFSAKNLALNQAKNLHSYPLYLASRFPLRSS